MLRTKKWIERLLCLSMVVILITACSPVLPNPTEAPVNSTPKTGEGLCANPYYPVRQGATWTYSSVESPSGDYSFTDTITSVRSDGFTLTSQFSDITRTQEWACRPEGITMLGLPAPIAAALKSQDVDLTLTVKNTNGVTFPVTIAVGNSWVQTMDFDSTIGIAGEQATAQGNIQTTFTAIAKESATVPAGTFNTVKVQFDSTLNVSATMQGLTIPVTFSSTYFYWLAEGVGWVKASGAGNIAGVSFNETLELQSFSIP